MGRVAVSFDDGLLDQFKWARGLYRYGISGTFYINPCFVGSPWILTLDQLKKMKNEWGHVIANHFWIHEAPAMGLSMDIILGNFDAAKKWLDDNGFEDGSRLLALTFGSEGGKWEEKHVNTLLERCDQVRDVGKGVNDFGARILTAVESTKFIDVDDKLMCHYFHGNHITSDRDFVAFLDGIKESGATISSMLEEASNGS